MVSTSSLCKSQALANSALKTWRKFSEDVMQSVQIVNTSNIKTVQESKNPSSRHIDHDCLINSVSSENQNKSYLISSFPAGIYLLKVNNRNTRTRCEICSKSTIMTPEQRQWRRSGVFIVDFEHISHLVLVFLLLTLSR